jgi:hypothetical protein
MHDERFGFDYEIELATDDDRVAFAAEAEKLLQRVDEMARARAKVRVTTDQVRGLKMSEAADTLVILLEG